MISTGTSSFFKMTFATSAARALLCAAIALCLSTTHANAALLFIDSFEGGTGTPAYANLSDSVFDSLGNGENGWTATIDAGYTDPTNTFFLGTTGNDVQGDLPDGGQSMTINEGVTITNNLAATSALGTAYTLSMRVGDSLADNPAQVSLILLVGGSPVATATGTPAVNTSSSPGTYFFDTLTTTPYVATASGQSIAIQISAVGLLSGDNFETTYADLVQLDATPGEANAVPEPATFFLAALGLAALGFVAWRRKLARC